MVTKKEKAKVVGDILYILQDTNKIQEGRIGFLPKYLDLYFNQALAKTKKIKRHYLISTKDGYYFKYGTKQNVFPFLNAIAGLLNTTVNSIKRNIINTLKNDKDDRIYTALNNGNIKSQFISKEKYIYYRVYYVITYY